MQLYYPAQGHPSKVFVLLDAFDYRVRRKENGQGCDPQPCCCRTSHGRSNCLGAISCGSNETFRVVLKTRVSLFMGKTGEGLAAGNLWEGDTKDPSCPRFCSLRRLSILQAWETERKCPRMSKRQSNGLRWELPSLSLGGFKKDPAPLSREVRGPSSQADGPGLQLNRKTREGKGRAIGKTTRSTISQENRSWVTPPPLHSLGLQSRVLPREASEDHPTPPGLA